jgi:hypothetical protein
MSSFGQRRGNAMMMGNTAKQREPTIGQLLADPMMAIVLQHSHTTADDLITLMIEARERLERAREAEASDDDQQDSQRR